MLDDNNQLDNEHEQKPVLIPRAFRQIGELEIGEYFEKNQDLAPKLDPAGYYGVLAAVVEAATKNSELVPETVALSFLVRWVARFGALATVPLSIYRKPLRLFGLTVGPSGIGRKGTSSDFAPRVFEAIDRLAPEFARLKRSPAITQPLHMLRDPVNSTRLIKTIDHQMTEWKTRAADPRLMMELPEMHDMLSICARHKTGSVVKMAFDNDMLYGENPATERTERPIHLGILGSITPPELFQFINHQSLLPLLARFTFGYSICGQVESNTDGVEQSEVDYLARVVLANLANAVPDGFNAKPKDDPSIALEFTPEGRDYWRHAYTVMREQVYANSVVRLLCNRTEHRTLMLSGTFALMNGEKRITPQMIRAALAWSDYHRETMNFLYAAPEQIAMAKMDGHTADIMLGTLERMNPPIRLSALIHRMVKNGFIRPSVDSALNMLAHAAPPRIKVWREPDPQGRPVPYVALAQPTPPALYPVSDKPPQ